VPLGKRICLNDDKAPLSLGTHDSVEALGGLRFRVTRTPNWDLATALNPVWVVWHRDRFARLLGVSD
jgi:hypothetical protein